MDLAAVIEQVRHLTGVRADGSAGRDDLERAMRTVARLEAWLAGNKAALTSRLVAHTSFPEQTVAACTRGSTRDAINDAARAATLDAAPGLAVALDGAQVTVDHVDAATEATRSLDAEQRDAAGAGRRRAARRGGSGVDHGVAATAGGGGQGHPTRRRHGTTRTAEAGDRSAHLDRRRRHVVPRRPLRSGHRSGPGRQDRRRGERVVRRGVPVDVPARSGRQAAASRRSRAGPPDRGWRGGGRPEYVVVVDTSQPDGAGGPVVDWGIPVDVPHRVLAQMMDGGTVDAVVVHNGVVLHVPGALDLGRTTRLANRAQRRALRALYSTCAIPGCELRDDRCKLHHVVWWRQGDRTDLDNLLPVCAHHHTQIHAGGWDVSLGSNRALTIRLPDGIVRNTGPPSRRAA